MTALNSWVSNLSGFKKYLLAFVLGTLIAAALPPLNLIFLLPVSFTGLLWILGTSTTRRQAFLAGWWFGWGQFIAGLYWIGVAFTVDAKTHALLMPLPVLVLPAILAIFSGCATLVTHMSKSHSLARIFIFSGAWMALEYVRGVIFTGFPWNVIGYSWSGILPVLQSTAFIGVYGLTLLTIFGSSLPSLFGEANTSRKTAAFPLATTAVIFAILYAVGIARIPSSATENFDDATLRIVQPNIPQSDKWKPDLLLEHLRKIVRLSLSEEGATPRYFIWPETAVPYYLTTTKQLQKELAQIIPPGGAIVTGAPRREPVVQQYWNSLQVLGEAGDILDVYDKQHLVPYGEYMPLRSIMVATGLSKIIPALDQMSDFATPDSSAKKVIFVPGLPPARALICYEIVFPWEIASETAFSWILNITNDGWFGTTSGPYQHFAMTRTRAIEQGVAVVRAANTGISAIIDPYGRVPAELALNDTGYLDGGLPLPIPERTLYARHGEAIPIGLVFAFFAIGIVLHRRLRKNTGLPS